MKQLESWFINFIKSPQCFWIVLLLVGFAVVEVIMHQEDKSYRKVASGISSCFGIFCVYVLTAVLFGPIHHSFWEKLQLSSCLPFISDKITGDDWAVFSFLSFPQGLNDLCLGILKLFIICIVYNLINDIIEKVLKDSAKRFLIWGGIQIGVLFVFTLLLSSVNYIISRLVFYVPWIGRILAFVADKSIIVCGLILVIMFLAVFAKVVLSAIAGKNVEEIPIMGFVVKIFFGSTVGMSLLKAAITTYFLIIVFKLVTITYIKTMVINSIGPLVFVIALVLVFAWYKLKCGLFPEGE